MVNQRQLGPSAGSVCLYVCLYVCVCVSFLSMIWLQMKRLDETENSFANRQNKLICIAFLLGQLFLIYFIGIY